MLSYDKNKFTLVIAASEEQKKEALEDFAKMNTKINNMFKYIENADTPQTEKEKFGPLSGVFLRTISETYNILIAMGIPEEQAKKHCKY
jgi:hypothetical protein